MDYLSHIVRDRTICGGEPVIRGTRVTLRTILASLAEGADPNDILAEIPMLTAEDVRAVAAFAAASTDEDVSGESPQNAACEHAAGLWRNRDDLPDFAEMRKQWDRKH